MAKPDQSTFKTGKGKERMQFVKDSGDSEGMVKVPKIYWNLSSKGVLTMEWIDGIKLTDKEALQKANLDARKLINQGVFCSLRQLLEEGFFHADPHPGNLVATKDGALAYFDFGMMGEFPRHYRIGFIRTLIHFVNRDSLGLANDFNYLGLTPKGTNMKLVAAALQKTFGNENSKSPLDFQGIMNQLSNVMYDFNFTLPPEFALVIRAMGSLEGTAKVLDPDFKVVASAYPFIIGRLLSDPDSDMRHILRELLIRHNGSIRWHRLERLVMAIAAQSFSTHSQAENSIGGSSNNAEDGFHKAPLFDVRAVVSATDDLLRFIFSEQGLRVRVLLVQDLVKALDSFLDHEIATSFEPRSKPGKEEKRANSKQNDGNLKSNETQRDNRSQSSQNKERSRHNSTEKEGNTENVEEILYTKSRVLAGIRTFANTVGSAPELWIPLLISLALKPEAQALFLDVLSSFSQTTYQSASEAFWLSLSRILHDSSL